MAEKNIKREDLVRLAETMDGPELAKYLGIARKTLYRLAEREGIHVRKPKGGRPCSIHVVD